MLVENGGASDVLVGDNYIATLDHRLIRKDHQFSFCMANTQLARQQRTFFGVCKELGKPICKGLFITGLCVGAFLFALHVQSPSAFNAIWTNVWELFFAAGIVASFFGQVTLLSYFRDNDLSKSAESSGSELLWIAASAVAAAISLFTLGGHSNTDGHHLHLFAVGSYFGSLAILDFMAWRKSTPALHISQKHKEENVVKCEMYKECGRQLFWRVDLVSFLIFLIFAVIIFLPSGDNDLRKKFVLLPSEKPLPIFVVSKVPPNAEDDLHYPATGIERLPVHSSTKDDEGNYYVATDKEKLKEQEKRKNRDWIQDELYLPFLGGALAFHMFATVFFILVHLFSWEWGYGLPIPVIARITKPSSGMNIWLHPCAPITPGGESHEVLNEGGTDPQPTTEHQPAPGEPEDAPEPEGDPPDNKND